jgi:phenylalanyl-tRNA synthetase alpha chain
LHATVADCSFCRPLRLARPAPLQAPAATGRLPEAYVDRVQSMHEVGGHGSVGYGYQWKRGEADKNILRTHTTAVSARMLYALANQPGGFKPAKYFSIDRVFRNESLDATHLAEFHQVRRR